MWYEDQPPAAEQAAAPPPRHWGFFTNWARRDPAPSPPANGSVPPPGVAGPAQRPPSAGMAACEPPHPLAEVELPDRVPQDHHLYGNAEALIWYVQRGPTPVLVTTGTQANPTAQPLVKDENFDDRERTGVRATAGIWLDHEETLGLEVGGFYLFERDPSARFASDGNQTLARPFINDITGNAEAYVLGGAGQTGGIDIQTMSRVWGAEANLRREVLRGCFCHLDLLGGFRFLELDESLAINDVTLPGPGSALAGSTFASSDNFGTRNRFYGGQVGVDAEFHVGHLDVGLWGKVALGDNAQTLSISGATGVLNPNGAQNVVANGLYTQPSNIGQYTHNDFGVLPEVGLNVGLQLTPHLRATAGYTFLLLTNAVRPGNQIDPVIDPGLVPGLGGAGGSGVSRPAAMFHESDFWAQGASAGLEFRY
jgi:Putative beta barrel porin-7 (BBP7)